MKNKAELREYKTNMSPEDVGSFDRQFVVEAGGCLHIASFEGGRFVLSGGRKSILLRGVTRVWALA